MTITRKAILKNDPPLQGTEIAIAVSGVASKKTDGLTFGFTRLALTDDSPHFTVTWGDGTSDTLTETTVQLPHVYPRAGVYRVRISDDISSVAVSAGAGSVNNDVYAPMVKRLRSTAAKLTSIGRLGFRGAVNLQSVDLAGSGVNTLIASAFCNCIGLTSAEWSRQLKTINSSAFAGCTGLTGRMDLPNVTTFNSAASVSPFANTGLSEFHFAAKHEGSIKASGLYQDTGGNLGVEGAVCYFDL